MERSFIGILVTVTWVALSATAVAQSDQQLDEAARLTFESAREAFVNGDYENALARFRQAFELSQRPGLLYNIAQSLDRLRRDEETVEALQAYLEAAPDAPNRPEVEARIRVLQRALEERAQQARAEEGAEEPEPEEDPVEPPRSSTEPLSSPAAERSDDGIGVLHPAMFIAAGVLTLAGGGLMIWAGLETLDRNDVYIASTDRNEIQVLYDEAQTYQTMTNIFLATTATFGVAAVVMAIFTDWNVFDAGESATAMLRPTFVAGPNEAVLGLGGDF